MSFILRKKVGFIISNNIFRDEEYFIPKQILENAGVKVITIAEKLKLCKGKLGGSTIPTLKISELNFQNIQNFDAIVLIGGSGSKDYWHNKIVHKIIKDTLLDDNKILAAICSAVATLAFAGIVKGKKVSPYKAEHQIVKELGGIIVNQPCIRDGKIITATDADASAEFGEAILQLLK